MIEIFYHAVSMVALGQEMVRGKKKTFLQGQGKVSLRLFFGGREATTGNASAVRRLGKSQRISV